MIRVVLFAAEVEHINVSNWKRRASPTFFEYAVVNRLTFMYIEGVANEPFKNANAVI